MTTPQLLTVPEAAKVLGVKSRNTVYGLIARGELPVVQIGKASRIDVRDLEAFIQAHKRTAA